MPSPTEALLDQQAAHINLVIDVISRQQQDTIRTMAAQAAGISTALAKVLSSIISGMVGMAGMIPADLSTLFLGMVTNIIGWVTSEADRILKEITSWKEWLLEKITAIPDTISSFIDSAVENIKKKVGEIASPIIMTIVTNFQWLWDWVSKKIGDVSDDISSFGDTLSKGISKLSTELYDWFNKNVIAPITTLYDSFLVKIFDFGSWVNKLMDAIASWVTRDIPGGSPWWQTALDSFTAWLLPGYTPETGLTYVTASGLVYAVFQFPFKVIGWILGFLASIFIPVIVEAAKPLAASLIQIFTSFVSKIIESAERMGPITPGSVYNVQAELNAVGTTVISGLIAMTIGGELTVLGSKVGLGNVSAMIYDLTNYKALTGAFISTLAFAAISTPLRYYYLDKFRPKLPNIREASTFYEKDIISKAEFFTLLGYEGFPNSWHEKFAAAAYRPVSLYTLASLANTGVYDEALFADNLRDWGLQPKWRPLLLAMYRNKSLETTKGLMSSVAITRYKEGLTNEEGFSSELQALRFTDKEIPLLLTGAKLSYATDYTLDLISAYTAAVNKGAISPDEYRDNLIALGLVRERVTGYVLKAQVYLYQAKKPTTVKPPVPEYETEPGKLEVDTLRRRRRKGIITSKEEIAALRELEMDADYAKAIADNDDARLTEKPAAE